MIIFLIHRLLTLARIKPVERENYLLSESPGQYVLDDSGNKILWE